MSPHTQPSATPATRSVVARMADFITSHAASAGGVTRDDLLLEFSDDEIESQFEAAKAFAREGVHSMPAQARRHGKGSRQ